MNLQTIYYVAYLTLCAVLIFGLLRVLHISGAVFLKDAIRDNETLASAIAWLLDIGFYLMSFGYVALTYRTWQQFVDYNEVVATVTWKLGGFALLLGTVHLFNVLLLALFRRRTNTPIAQPAA
jgi:hypothetical protein